ncbi:MAG TPA: hypothetical protein VFE53_22260 [Mucilaginibacter sp.]|jgi:hypothetical protein|nr:hypothetical protein [Mucilaginibacter sp.]
MKKKAVIFALVIAAFVSVTSGCASSHVYYAAYHHTAWRGY